MKVAGVGFRDDASLASVQDALARAGAADVTRLALAARRAGHPLIAELTAHGFQVTWVSDRMLSLTDTPTQSPIARRHYRTGSLAEAAALAAARVDHPDARLAGPRAISADRLATAALALALPVIGDPG